MIGRYEIQRPIGAGGMGVLWLARDPMIDRLVAIKLMREGVESATSRERFMREARSAGRLHHPNIVVVFDGGIEGDTPFIAMELVNGPTLAAELERRGTIPPADTARLVRKIGEGLEYAHRHGVVHRDLKTANILLTQAGEPKISDFGVAKLLSADSGVTETPVGTPRNMSPEQVSGSPIDGRSDVFALGILAYELLTGISPFAGEHCTAVVYNILNNDPLPPSRVNPELPPAVDAPILRALSKDRDHRTPDPLTLADELDRAVGIGVVPKRRPPRGAASDIELGASDLEAFRQLAPERQPTSRSAPLVAGVVGGLLLLAILFLLFRGCGEGEAPPVEATPTEEAPPPTRTREPTRRPTARPTAVPIVAPPTAVPTERPTPEPRPTSPPQPTRAPAPTGA
ncbi:MAG: protein kinase domain-containing protein, partial [Candidatus Binatia bacterium]